MLDIIIQFNFYNYLHYYHYFNLLNTCKYYYLKFTLVPQPHFVSILLFVNTNLEPIISST